MQINAFQQAVLQWFTQHGRRHLPWQQQPTPYRVWLSEIMLQQTQVATVINYFNRFIQKFPTITTLADATDDDVLSLWSGLGYYARARHLHQTAKIITRQFLGQFPKDLLTLQQLPGIGRSTAGAILAMAMHQKAAILDGNVKRLFARLFLLHPWQSIKSLWDWAEKLAPTQHIAAYTQALMDLGATICVRSQPKCHICPLTTWCLAYQQQRQVEFPGKLPKKTLLVKATQLLLLSNKYQELCLQKRPAQGIWSGLWSLPEYVSSLSLKNYCAQYLACDIALAYQLPAFKHTFTHFHLMIAPIVVAVRKDQLTMPYRWFTDQQLLSVGLPTPIRQIIVENT